MEHREILTSLRQELSTLLKSSITTLIQAPDPRTTTHIKTRRKNNTSEIGSLVSTMYNFINLSVSLEMKDKNEGVNMFLRKVMGNSYNNFILDALHLFAKLTEKAEQTSLLTQLLTVGRA